jgi:hypothetical protein
MDMQAKHNVDFIGGEGDLTFNHGETSKTLSFAIMDSMVKNYFYYLKFRHSIPIYVNITVNNQFYYLKFRYPIPIYVNITVNNQLYYLKFR